MRPAGFFFGRNCASLVGTFPVARKQRRPAMGVRMRRYWISVLLVGPSLSLSALGCTGSPDACEDLQRERDAARAADVRNQMKEDAFAVDLIGSKSPALSEYAMEMPTAASC